MAKERKGKSINSKDYDARNKSTITLTEAQAVVGKRASLTFTGTIVDAGATESGTYVKFELDERWGFPPGTRYVMDLDPFELE